MLLDDLPLELIADIVDQLPYRDVARLRGVSCWVGAGVAASRSYVIVDEVYQICGDDDAQKQQLLTDDANLSRVAIERGNERLLKYL